ncbi:MAG: glycogen debranching enzyme N-terminal domain-containing protein, partial [Chloroflexia bacterium]
MITIPRSVCIDLSQALEKEWLVCNGIGGYGSGTVAGTNTRRYHGYLVAALGPSLLRVNELFPLMSLSRYALAAFPCF